MESITLKFESTKTKSKYPQVISYHIAIADYQTIKQVYTYLKNSMKYIYRKLFKMNDGRIIDNFPHSLPPYIAQ